MQKVITALLGGTYLYLSYGLLALTTVASQTGSMLLLLTVPAALFFSIIGVLIVWLTLTHGPKSRDLSHLTVLGLAGPFFLVAWKLIAVTFTPGTIPVWAILSLIGGIVCIWVALILVALSTTPTTEETEKEAANRLEELKIQAIRQGYVEYPNGTFSRHIFSRKDPRMLTGYADDYEVFAQAKHKYRFFLSEANTELRYEIYSIRYNKLFVILDTRDGSYSVYES